MDGSRALTRVLVSAATVLLSPSLSAQTLEGVLLAGPDDTPLGGAYVVLTDWAGSDVALAISDGAGRFVLEPPTPGRYSVRGERVGYRSVEVAVEVPAVSTVQIRTTFLAIETSTLSTDLNDRCEISLKTAQGVAALWNEVAKALRVAALVQDDRLLGFEVARWYRSLEPRRLRARDENRQVLNGFHAGNPMVTPSPEALSRGYIQGGEGEGYSFYSPDVHTLLSESFQNAHCFGFEDSGPEEGWMGLSFRPRHDDVMDIEGTLWIDAATYEPRRLDFRYSSLPWRLRTDKLGGRIEFQRVLDGPWIVSRWWIRMPRVDVRTTRITQWDPPAQRYSLASVVEEGGEVLSVSGAGPEVVQIR